MHYTKGITLEMVLFVVCIRVFVVVQFLVFIFVTCYIKLVQHKPNEQYVLNINSKYLLKEAHSSPFLSTDNFSG